MIRLGVDRPGPWRAESFIENPTFIRVSLSDVKVIMLIMCAIVVELPC
jgi:hypothetical protein